MDYGRLLLICAVACGALSSGAAAQTPGEERFFRDCPRRPLVVVHDEANPWDPHVLLYTTAGLSEIEVLRAADWLIDAPIPGHSLRPFQRTVQVIRTNYDRLPPWTVRQRIGEFFDALHLTELSFGDASTTYTVATGGATGPGSGMVVRINALIDWTQHVIGDVNALSGRVVGRSGGLVTWSWSERAVDRTQWMLFKGFNAVTVLVSQTLDYALTVGEAVAGGVANVGRETPHQERTAFLRLPLSVYRAHEVWFLEHRPQLVVGMPEDFWSGTHATLAHRRRPLADSWERIDHMTDARAPLVVMAESRVIRRAPATLQPYVVPAAWVLNAP